MFGIRFTDTAAPVTLPDGRSTIPRDKAIETAMNYTAGAGPNGLMPDVEVSARFGYFSNDVYAAVSPSGQNYYYFQNRPIWLVTFSGLNLLPSMGMVLSKDPNVIAYWEQRRQQAAHHEENVAIDAGTGEYLQMYSYQ